MKRLLVLVALTLFVLTSINAATYAENSPSVLLQGQTTEITYDDLPDAVKAALSADTYSEWEINTIHKVDDPNNQVYYSIEFLVNSQSHVVNFDAKGNVLQ